MVATKKKTIKKPRTVDDDIVVASSSSTLPKELKLKKVKKCKKPLPEGSDVPEVVKKPKVKINMEYINELEEKEILATEEIQPLTVSQLKNLCKLRKVVGYSGKRKEQIMTLLIPISS